MIAYKDFLKKRLKEVEFPPNIKIVFHSQEKGIFPPDIFLLIKRTCPKDRTLIILKDNQKGVFLIGNELEPTDIVEKEEKLKPLPLDFVLKLISLLKITGEWERLKI